MGYLLRLAKGKGVSYKFGYWQLHAQCGDVIVVVTCQRMVDVWWYRMLDWASPVVASL